MSALRRILLIAGLLGALQLATSRAQESGVSPPLEITLNGVEFVLIPDGWFWYDVEAGDSNRQKRDSPMYRQVRVWLDGFYIAKFEARAADHARFLNAKGAAHAPDEPRCALVRDSDGTYSEARPGRNWPATDLSWIEAEEFARWMGFRLPTEAEWQKAARGSERRIWPWGNEYPDDTVAHFTAGRHCNPVPVDALPKGRSPYGIYNMSGNVSEYVADWFNREFDAGLKDGVKNPPKAAQGSPIPFSQPSRIVKGGRWSTDPAEMAVARRGLSPGRGATNRDGVRFALDVATALQLLAEAEHRLKFQERKHDDD